jgi:hypothetical protein
LSSKPSGRLHELKLNLEIVIANGTPMKSVKLAVPRGQLEQPIAARLERSAGQTLQSIGLRHGSRGRDLQPGHHAAAFRTRRVSADPARMKLRL